MRICVTKGVRIDSENITIDLPKEEAQRLRMLLLTFKRLPDIQDADIILIRQLCDGLSGPLPCPKEEVMEGNLWDKLHRTIDRELLPKRHPNYRNMSPREQWEDDRKNGYLNA